MAIRSQRGFTLLEMLLVTGLAAFAIILALQSKQADLEQSQARALGPQLFQYNNAVRNYLAKNNQVNPGSYSGTGWLKNTSCGGPFPLGSEYLPCTFPNATTVNPMSYGAMSLETKIEVSGAAPDRKLTATTVSSPFKITHSGTRQTRSDLAGLAAITAAAGFLPASSGSGFGSTTDSSFSADPFDGKITMISSNSADQDIWLRTDGGNNMHANLKFDNPDALNRQITGASRIQNLAAEALYLGRQSGVAPLSGAGLIMDASTEIIGALRIRNDLKVDNGASITGNVSASGDISAGGAAMAQIFYDSNNTQFFVDPSATSNINALQAKTIQAEGRVSTKEYLSIGGVATLGNTCTPNGLMGRDSTGKILSCQSGKWGSNAGNLTGPVQLYSGRYGGTRCFDITRNALITVTAPGTTTMTVNGTRVGRAYSYGGKYSDVASDATITHVASAGAKMCYSNGVVNSGLVLTGGTKVMATYLD